MLLPRPDIILSFLSDWRCWSGATVAAQHGGLVDTEAAAGLGWAGLGWAGDGNNNSVESWAQLRDQIRAEGGQWTQ